MAQDEIKKVIDNILNEKMQFVLSKISQTQNSITAQLEELKQLDQFPSYSLPPGLQVSRAGDSGSSIDFLHNSIKKIAYADNQLNLINSLLEGLNHFCSRAALFLIKEDKLVGWKGKGFSKHGGGISDDDIKKVFISLSAATVFKYVLDNQNAYAGAHISQADDHLIYSRIGGESPENIYVLPFFVKGKPQAVIYTDSLDGKKISKKEVEMLATVGEMSLDLLPLRQKLLTRVQTKKFDEEPEEEAPPPYESTSQDDDEITQPSIKESDPQRLARVIINDIILYNEKAVAQGRKNRNLYKALEDTIMQAKEQFLMRYSNLEAFEEQLVKNLAKGDRDALKGYKFEVL